MLQVHKECNNEISFYNCKCDENKHQQALSELVKNESQLKQDLSSAKTLFDAVKQDYDTKKNKN